MAIQRQYCVNHPARAAIGICVMTSRPICEECSTRYEGVNYSREGLLMLQQQRAAKEKSAAGFWGRAMRVAMWILSPVALFLVYLSYLLSAEALASLIRG